MVALELLRAISNWNDHGFGRFRLHYVRTKEKEEADFLITENNKPFLLVETKFSEDTCAKSLLQFQNLLNIPAIQLVHKEGVYKFFKNNNKSVLIITAHQWLSSLP